MRVGDSACAQVRFGFARKCIFAFVEILDHEFNNLELILLESDFVFFGFLMEIEFRVEIRRNILVP